MYNHGITVLENATPTREPAISSGLQVVVGTAPIHMAANLSAIVNQPIVAYSWSEAVEKLGFSDDFAKYTLCQSMYASFKMLEVAPVVFINVLDPEIHKTAGTGTVAVVDGVAKVDTFGVLLDTLVVKSTAGATTYVKGTDYFVAFDQSGYPVISTIAGRAAENETQLQLEYSKLDPSKVTEMDIIGGYDIVTGKYSGLECIQQVYPKLGLVPGIFVAPGWSKNPTVAAVMRAKSKGINGAFNCMNVLDLDTEAIENYQSAPDWKEENGYIDPSSIVAYPKVKSSTYILDYSAVLAATASRLDTLNDNVPYKSPSNKVIPITATVKEDGTEIYLDQAQANFLNGHGIVTAVNFNGWRTWGNNTAAYPAITDPKDRFISIKRMFFWWGNTFILEYHSKVDDPTNLRLIEHVVDNENIRANGFQSQGKIAGAKIEFRADMNPIENILDGKLRFIQKVAFFPPAEHIINELEFDPNMLSASIFGGE